MIKAKSDAKLRVNELVELAVLAAITFAGKLAMSAIPNVHPVALMLIVITSVYGTKAFYAAFVYVMLEYLVYGFGIWTLPYLYIWPLLVGAVLLFRKNESRLVWALIAGVHGLLYGVFCSVPNFFIGGWATAFSFWVAGIPYDLIHGISNFVLVFLLVLPIRNVVLKMHKNR